MCCQLGAGFITVMQLHNSNGVIIDEDKKGFSVNEQSPFTRQVWKEGVYEIVEVVRKKRAGSAGNLCRADIDRMWQW